MHRNLKTRTAILDILGKLLNLFLEPPPIIRKLKSYFINGTKIGLTDAESMVKIVTPMSSTAQTVSDKIPTSQKPFNS